MRASAFKRISWFFILGAVLALVFFVQPKDISGAAPQAAQTTYRIMPLGDSITQGSRPYDSYRRPLWHLLQNNGFTNVDFVGSMSRNSEFDPPNPDFDPNHEGHGGWRADELAGQIVTWATAAQPDIVLLHAGSNDVFQWESDSSTIADLSLIIDRLRQVNPNVKILLAQIIPHNRANTPFGVENLNALIANLGVSKNTAQSPVIVVDQYTGFNVATDTYDNVHPNVSGEQKIAQKWYQALMPLLTPPPVGSTAAPTATATATTAPGTTGFYRAVNFGGPALTIDGNNWEADGAPGVTVQGYSSCKPSMVLSPTTDANRATMLRCYRWNQGLTVSMASTPNGSYDVYLYVVDEDAWPQTFGVTLEGQVVANNLSTGANGQWQRLGPWRVNLTDGTINLGITGDGWNAFPGIEVWNAGSGTPVTATSAPTNPPTRVPTLTPTNTPTTVPFPTLIPSATPTNAAPPTLAPTATNTSVVGTSSFYRAINFGGPAVVIDGNNWEADGAPGVTVQGNSECNPNLALNPAADANRTTMLRCYRWNQKLTVSMANMPAGTYDVYLYVIDSDQWSQTFGVTLEGQVVANNLSTGVNGQWQRLGPWRVNLTDGTINLGITGNGWNAFPGIEVWSVGGGTPNTATPTAAATHTPTNVPTLVPTNTPTDVPLPTLIPSATPTDIPLPTLIPSATPTDVVPPTSVPTATQPPVSSGLYRAINLGGPALTIDGNNWEADGAPGVTVQGYSGCSPNLVLNPATDANRTTMLRCYRWNQGLTVSMANMPAGTYDVYLYNVDEDAWAQTFGVTLEGQSVATNLSTGVNGQWIRFGPWRVTVADGTLNLAITGDGWNAFSGIEVWNAGGASLSGAPANLAPQQEMPVIPTALPTDASTLVPLAAPTDVPQAEATEALLTEEAAPGK